MQRVVIEKFATIQMPLGRLPTPDRRRLVMSLYTEPQRELCLLSDQLNLTLPEQAPPKDLQARLAFGFRKRVVPTF